MEEEHYRERDMASFNEAVDMMTEGTAGFDPRLVRLIAKAVEPEAEKIALAFYREMLALPAARAFLDHELVESRLGHSMEAWIRALFEVRDESALRAYLLQQTRVGQVHSRISVPIALVKRGAAILKGHVFSALEKSFSGDSRLLVDAMRLSDRMLELAVFFINLSYVVESLNTEQTVLAFRQQATSRYTALDCERIKASVFDWIRGFFSQIYFKNARGLNDIILPEQTDFGLWVRYKADMLFPDQKDDVAVLKGNIEEMSYLARRAAAALSAGGQDLTMDTIVSRMNEIAIHVSFLLSSFVSVLLEAEAGRDQLTQVYNRKYLPIIMRNAVRVSMEGGERFAVAILDIDHFKNVNDTYGHDRGDTVLEKISEILIDSVRMGDSVFRYGGEEFLVVLLGVDAPAARNAAEKLRRRIEEASVNLGEGRSIRVTVSIGVALHDGHPDYSRTISQADEALYRAKELGRNRVALAGSAG